MQNPPRRVSSISIVSLTNFPRPTCTDAVASVGGHTLDMDALGIDLMVIGAQKALAGPPRVSVVVVSERAWAHIEATPDAATASRAGLRAMGIEPWIADDWAASALITSAPVPPGIDGNALLERAARFDVPPGRGFGDLDGRIVRIAHTGVNAAFHAVLAALVAYGSAARSLGALADPGAAAEAVAAVYGSVAAGQARRPTAME
jgi:aspartate aminotransferase-like enzyme